MGEPVDDGKFTKIFIERYEHTAIAMCFGKDLFITGIFLPFPDPYDIMLSGSQVFDSAAPNACIQEDFHVPVSKKIGSTLSCPTSLRA